MTDLPHREDIQGTHTTRSAAAALVAWLVCQLALLAAICADLRISANPNHTAAQLGLSFLLAGQFILSAALFGDIARTPRLAAIAFAISFPITQLAGWKCGSGPATSLLYSAVLLVWLAGLLLWMQTARSDRPRHLLAAALMLWIMGTPLLWYILAEFAPGSTVEPLIAMTSPVMLVGHATHLLSIVAIHSIIAAIAAAIAQRLAHRSSTNPQVSD